MTEAVGFEKHVRFAKVNRRLGVVFGWAIVSKINGKPYIDEQGHYIPPDSMLAKSLDFMLRSRKGGEMHRKGDEKDEHGKPVAKRRGEIVFAFPMTEEIAKAFGMESRLSGLMIGYRPDDDCREEILAKFDSGEYTGFSIGGKLFKSRPLDETEES